MAANRRKSTTLIAGLGERVEVFIRSYHNDAAEKGTPNRWEPGTVQAAETRWLKTSGSTTYIVILDRKAKDGRDIYFHVYSKVDIRLLKEPSK